MILARPLYLVMIERGNWAEAVWEKEEDALAWADKEKKLDRPGVFSVQAYPASQRFPTPMHKGWYQRMVAQRFIIPKANLKDGCWYIGRCRNANFAQWDGTHKFPEAIHEPHKSQTGCFVHWREKFDRTFVETINHPEDDDEFDLFWPVERVYPDAGWKDIRGKG